MINNLLLEVFLFQVLAVGNILIAMVLFACVMGIVSGFKRVLNDR